MYKLITDSLTADALVRVVDCSYIWQQKLYVKNVVWNVITKSVEYCPLSHLILFNTSTHI